MNNTFPHNTVQVVETLHGDVFVFLKKSDAELFEQECEALKMSPQRGYRPLYQSAFDAIDDLRRQYGISQEDEA